MTTGGDATPLVHCRDASGAATTAAPSPSRSAAELRAIAQRLRLNALGAAEGKGEAYIGQALQTADLFAVLFFDEMSWTPSLEPDADHFILSVGHYALSYYAVLAELGAITAAQLSTYGADGSPFTLGIEPGEVPGVEFAGGSLGQGLGFAAGVAIGDRAQGRTNRTYAYVSDGEIQEGAVWEAAMLAGHHRLDNLTCIVDVNRTQADGELVIEVEPLTDKFAAFGWWAVDVDGHDIGAIRASLRESRSAADGRPVALIAATTLGRGSELISSKPNAHFIRIRAEEWRTVRAELETATR